MILMDMGAGFGRVDGARLSTVLHVECIYRGRKLRLPRVVAPQAFAGRTIGIPFDWCPRIAQ